MIKKIALLFIMGLFLLSSCAASTSQESRSNEAAPQEAGAAPAAPSFDGSFEKPAVQATAMVSDNGIRIVLRNANLTIVVDDPGAAMATISRMAEEMGGFVVSSNLYKTYAENELEVPEANITIRVRAESLNDALDQIKSLVKDPEKDVRTENVSGQDVTREYTDLQSRLTNLEQAEAQLREIMESAVRTDDVLAVHQQLTQIREQIEVIKGQIQYYEEASALSSISVLIQAQAGVQPLEIGGWQPVGVARDAVQSLIDALQFLGSAAIWLVLFLLPILLIIYLPIRLLWGLYKRSRKNQVRQTPTPPAAP